MVIVEQQGMHDGHRLPTSTADSVSILLMSLDLLVPEAGRCTILKQLEPLSDLISQSPPTSTSLPVQRSTFTQGLPSLMFRSNKATTCLQHRLQPRMTLASTAGANSLIEYSNSANSLHGKDPRIIQCCMHPHRYNWCT